MMADSGFWETMNILVGKEWKKSGKEVMDDVQDWLENVIVRKEVDGDDECKKTMPDDYNFDPVKKDKEIRKFIKKLKLPKIECNFSNPQVRSRLEKLMGSNYVSLTDRKYMQRLQERILEDYAESMDKRIKAREVAEMDRVKNLVLVGKIPIEEAPPEMANHPIMLIENYCNQLIAERRAKIKIPKVKIPTYLYWDDTPDPPSGLSIEQGHVFRKGSEKMCVPATTYLASSFEEEIENGYMFTEEEYNRLKYENPLVKQLISCQSVEEMYSLADEIIGVLKTIDESLAVRPNEETILLANTS